METGKLMGKAADVLFGPRIKGIVLAVHEDRNGSKKVIVDCGSNSVAVEQAKFVRMGPFQYVTRPQPSVEFKPGDIFDARTQDFKTWKEGERI